MTRNYGATVADDATHFVVRSPEARSILLCLFDGDREHRIAMQRDGPDWVATCPGDLSGTRYGYRADGVWAPERGLWFDPTKLLVDPYATQLDRRFIQDPRLNHYQSDSAAIVPRAIVPQRLSNLTLAKPYFNRGELIYEINVRGFTMLHTGVPTALRGTVAALAHPVVIAHLKKLGVSAVELMPVTAWIDERHLTTLGLCNAWGYNPVTFLALDPGLCPGGVTELRETVAALHAEGIGVILDLVFNHTGESDTGGGILSLRGLDNAAYAHAPDGSLINDTGCGNTLDFANPNVRALVLASLRHFVGECGVDGFRFDLATIMARGPAFSARAPIFAEIAADPLLADRILIAEPWDIGQNGYQLGQFPDHWLEWNDRYRDDVRRFWRGDGPMGALITRVAGSSDIFGKACRSVNFLAAHDGFTLADVVAYEYRHNMANGEDNRDGHGENYSWNNGVEGESADAVVIAARAGDLRALLSTLFASTGSIMLTAGDEFGRSQRGNNNAYAQDNETSWINWSRRDLDLEDFVATLAEARAARGMLSHRFPDSGTWLRADSTVMSAADWDDPATDAVSYVTTLADTHATLKVSRSARTASWALP
jgi:glycogen debranching enzyme